MDISLNKSSLTFLVKALEGGPYYTDGFYGQREIQSKLEMCNDNARVIVNLARLKIEVVEQLIDYLKASRADEDGLMLINSFVLAMRNPDSVIIQSVRSFPSIFAAWLIKGHIHGWLFQQEADGSCVPWLVDEIKFHPKYKDSPSYVSIRLICNVAGGEKGIGSKSLMFEFKDLYQKRVEEVLIKHSLIKETPELVAQYEKDILDFKKYIGMHGKQFVPSASFLSADTEDSGHSRMTTIKAIEQSEKFVNDDRNAKRLVIEEHKSYFWNSIFNAELFKAMLEDEAADTNTVNLISSKIRSTQVSFDRLPVHLKIRLFNLNKHFIRMIHVSKVKPYVYKTDIENKLILPDDHHDLIKMLTQEVGDFGFDVIDGKNLGCNILCIGKPGLGKTLTAEIYSEVCQKPLYRVHSGQLGSDAVSIEKNLESIMTRATDWGAILLIDEADVFIRARNDDMDHNAIVSVFLRKMEYYSGLLFMTSNREEDIDDAITSRCIAIIRYKTPQPEELKGIWMVQNAQMDAGMSESLIDELVNNYKGMSGRDVNRLLALTKRYADNKGIPLDAESFRKCAVFRGVV